MSRQRSYSKSLQPVIDDHKQICAMIGRRVDSYGQSVQELYGTDLMKVQTFDPRKDWRLIMPILEFITAIDGGRYEIKSNPAGITFYDTRRPERIKLICEVIATPGAPLIKLYYTAIVTFTRWYCSNTRADDHKAALVNLRYDRPGLEIYHASKFNQ